MKQTKPLHTFKKMDCPKEGEQTWFLERLDGSWLCLSCSKKSLQTVVK